MRRALSHTTSLGQLVRFGLLGAMNTLSELGAVLRAAVLPGVADRITLSYLAGVSYVVTLTPRFVFRTRTTQRQRVALGVWYVLVYLVGLAAVALMHADVTASHLLTVMLTLCVTSSLGFLGSRYIVGRS
jgi:hypothetical protein